MVGAGIVGLSTAYALRRYPVTVRCYDAAEPMSGRSRGDTRIFRLAHDTATLVRYAVRAGVGWARWERTAGRTLVGAETTVISGDGAAERYATMRAAGVRCGLHEGARSVAALPASADTPGPFLVDPAGGVIRAAATGAFLRQAVGRTTRTDAVERVTVHGDTATIHSAGGSWQCDAVLIAAGTGTPALAAPLGIDVPDRLEHHFRFTFPLTEGPVTERPVTEGVGTEGRVTEGVAPPCWIERSSAWRDGFTTYGHAVAAGRWAVGAHLPAEDTDWSLPVDEARRRASAAVTAYVTEFLGGTVEPTVLDEVYCAPTVGLGDGVQVARTGPVLAVWGENLFKLAPALGADLAAAVASRGLPEDLP